MDRHPTHSTPLTLALALVAGIAAATPEPARAAGRPPAAACFAPGTPDYVVQETARRLAGQALSLAAPTDDFTFDDNDRWSRTAIDGSGLGQGDRTTLTWSYVPDGTSICGFIGEPTAPSELNAWLAGIYGDFTTWHALFQDMFNRWSELTGITYVYEPNDDGAAFGCTSLPSGVVGVRGDVRISAHPIDGDSGVLAYNFFPNSGDMVLESDDSFYDNTSSESLRLRNVLAHEH